MDIFSHALWTNVAYGKARKHAAFAMLMGILPDIISFSPFFSQRLFFSEDPLVVVKGQEYGSASVVGLVQRPEFNEIPQYVFTLYNWTHSLVIFAVVFLLIYLITRNVWLPIFGWTMHIGIDIFTHTQEIFPTPFLWPLGSFKTGLVSWGHPVFLGANFAILAIVYSAWYVRWSKTKKASRLSNRLAEVVPLER